MEQSDPTHLVRLGRAYVRLIEAAQLLIAYAEHDGEVERLRQLAKDYQAGLRELVGKVPAHVSADIMAASEKVLGTVQNVGLN